MNAIAFSLYGSDPKYCIGAIKNVMLAKIFYPDWQCILWIGEDVPKEIRQALISSGALLRNGTRGLCGHFWRFMVNDFPRVGRYIVRDTDSRIGERERLAVKEWEASGKGFHVMRDHPHHRTPIMAGMFGAVAGVIPSMKNLIDKCENTHSSYCADQNFMASSVWPLVKKDSLQHDSCCRDQYPEARPFPSRLNYTAPRFVGEVFDEHDQPRAYDWELMLNHIC